VASAIWWETRPSLPLPAAIKGQRRTIYTKAENLNMTGSIKDRMALYILRQAYARGVLTPGAAIAEATSGNTASPSRPWVGRSASRHDLHARVDEPGAQGPDPKPGGTHPPCEPRGGRFPRSIKLSEEFAAATPGAFLPKQFANEDNVAAHAESTGPEIWWQLRFHGLSPDAFVAGVGTGGTVMGVGRFLRQMKPAVKCTLSKPANSPTLSTGHK